MSAKTTPTKRSMDLLRKRGWMVGKVEFWNNHCKIRQDLWNFGDLIACKHDEVALIQSTTASNVSARIAKIRGIESARIWLLSQYRTIYVHGWALRGERGKRKTWQCREERIHLYSHDGYTKDPKYQPDPQ